MKIDFKDRDTKDLITERVLYTQEINIKEKQLEISFFYYNGEQEKFLIIKKDNIRDLRNPKEQWCNDKPSVCCVEIKYKYGDYYEEAYFEDISIKFNIEDIKKRDELFEKLKKWWANSK